MTRFAANLGFLWADLPLADAVRAAHRAGFDAVECHWPRAEDIPAVRAALAETGLPMLGLNTARGGAGQFGLSALPGREDEARAAIDHAFDMAAAFDCPAVHVMAGAASGPKAEAAFRRNLDHAFARAAAQGAVVLIEPLNPADAPGYFLSSAEHALAIIRASGHPALRMMLDCYHLERIGGDVLARLPDWLPLTGHVQIAGVPDRGPPGRGALDYRAVCAALDDLGWTRPVGAEYRPGGPTEASLDWLTVLRGQ